MPKREQPGAAGGDHPRSVLIVDDQQATRALLRAAFEGLSSSYRLREAADGEAALQLAREEPPDLVLLDVVLPGSSTSGILVCNQLCREGARVVIVSGQASPAVVEACLSSGAVDYVPKPFSVEGLREKVQKWMAD